MQRYPDVAEATRQEPLEREAQPETHRTSPDIKLSFDSVSAAIATEAAVGSLAAVAERGEGAADFKSRLSRALDTDLATWLGEVKHSQSADYAQLVRMLKEWNRKSAPSRGILLELMLEATLDPLTWRTAFEDVGPHPSINVVLFIPGSYAHATRVEPLRAVDFAVVYRGAPHVGEEIGDLTEAMTPSSPLPTPPVVLQARRNAEARAALFDEFGALTAAQVAELAGSEAKNTSALAGRWRREGRLVAVEHHGTTYYPAFQFDADGRPRATVAEVLKFLSGPDITPWQRALWFTTANGWLDGRRPVDHLDEQPAAIVAAAREALREPVG